MLRTDALSELGARGRERLARLGLASARLGPRDALAGAFGYSDFLLRIFSGLDRETAAVLLRTARAPLCRANATALLDRAPSLAQGTERALAWIALRELTGLACVRESLLAASLIATLTLRRAFAPEQRDAAPDLVIFALGKLGGRELNFYSDLDLVIGSAASVRDRAALATEPRLRRILTRLEGGFRVDLRLRPFGQSGPLVMNLAAMEAYFHHHGREWERYAWIKARAVAGNCVAGRRFLEQIRPFIFRRYLDYHAIEALREMKRRIAEEAGVDNRDIKRGPGGIREIEFVVQAFQLVRGGRNGELAGTGLAGALRAAMRLGLLPAGDGEHLAAGYYFLRRLENRLQMENLNPVHHLPESTERRDRLAASLGHANWDDCLAQLEIHREQVREIFERIFGAAAPAIPTSRSARWWRDAAEPQADTFASEAGFPDGEAASLALAGFKASRAVRLMHARGRLALDRVMPDLLDAIGRLSDPNRGLDRLLRLLAALLRRSVYFALLAERPAARETLARLAGESEWMASRLAATPAAFDELLDVGQAPGDRASLQRLMKAVLADDNAQLATERLRDANETQRLQLAAQFRDGRIGSRELERSLTVLAELSVRTCLGLALQRMQELHGELACNMLVLAYGKLGSGELGLTSDLDLVFIHETTAPSASGGLAAEAWLLRLAQRTISLLSLPTAAGSLYAVDARLRPEGAAGLLLTSFAAWLRYQRETARLWERQALLRARPVAGSAELARRFHRERRLLLTELRTSPETAKEIVAMRARVAASGRERDEIASVLLDGEFLAAYWLLRLGPAHPRALRPTRLAAQLGLLATSAALPEAQTLAEALEALRAARNARILGMDPDTRGFLRARDHVVRLWREVFGDAPL